VNIGAVTPGSEEERPRAIPIGEAFRFWLKLGFLSFGGPAGQIAVMHQELVEGRRWISEHRFLHALNYCMLLPGPEAQQLATYIGWLMHRTWGGVIAGGLFVLPSLIILMALSWGYMTHGEHPMVAAVFFGIKPAVVAIVAFAAWRIGARVLRNAYLVAIAVAAFVAIFALGLPFPLIVLGAGLGGWLGGKIAPGQLATKGSHANAGKNYGPALIDDHTPPPPHARFRWRHLIFIAAIGLMAWFAMMAVLVSAQGRFGTLPQMGWFFTKAAFLTFGGAYAVLPYVYQGAVDQHHWLTAPQMIDGLALGETTPGPLIMVVTFVGYVGAWTHAAAQSLSPAVAGLLGGLTATYFTFLPSFIMIFGGAPLVEATRGNHKFTAPLTAITAAVAGVILNLALFFAYHVFWPRGFAGDFDWISALLGLAAAVALFRFKLGVIPVVAGSGVVGLALWLLGVA
jgi:chromate transporter